MMGPAIADAFEETHREVLLPVPPEGVIQALEVDSIERSVPARPFAPGVAGPDPDRLAFRVASLNQNVSVRRDPDAEQGRAGASAMTRRFEHISTGAGERAGQHRTCHRQSSRQAAAPDDRCHGFRSRFAALSRP
jgi:hypothetical protein